MNIHCCHPIVIIATALAQPLRYVTHQLVVLTYSCNENNSKSFKYEYHRPDQKYILRNIFLYGIVKLKLLKLHDI